jgi:RNA polymerase sigma-70 factor (ECF subfamily)
LEDYAPYDNYGSLGGKVKSKEWSNNPYLILYRKEALEIIENAIADLPEKYRIVLLLRDIEQLPQDEISSILGISVGAVKSRLHRARLFVRDKISDYFQEWRK